MEIVFSGLIGFAVGAVVGLMVLVLHLRSRPATLVVAFLATLCIQAGLTFYWHGPSGLTGLHLVDFIVIAIYALIGCVLGGVPPLVLRAFWRQWRRPDGT